jgi:hypothetical protein
MRARSVLGLFVATLVFPVILWAAITAVQYVSASVGGALTENATFGSTPTAGDIVVSGCAATFTGVTHSGSSCLSTDNKGNSYTSSAFKYGGGRFGGASIEIDYAANIATGSSFTLTGTSNGTSDANNAAAVVGVEYSGIATSSPGDGSSSGPGAATTAVTCGTITTTNANDVLVAVISMSTSSTPITVSDNGSGFTVERTTSVTNLQVTAIADKIVSSTGSYSPAFTLSATPLGWSCVAAAFKAIGGVKLNSLMFGIP